MAASQAEDLSPVIDKGQSFCLNEDAAHSFGNLFIGDETLFLRSSSDDQLIILISFKDTVKLESVSFVAPIGDESPSTVKLFINNPSMDFSDCEEGKPVQALELTPEDLAADSVTNLYSVKFQRVNSLTIFVEESTGGDLTQISGLKLFGTTVQGTNMAEFKKVG
uniref:PITH domain-containing protein n=1 Tax=Rhizochromulina marina TaxID=1034831 RepID=A0A7S2SRN7_9STRA